MHNLFEIYLPVKLRPTSQINESRKWCLIENNEPIIAKIDEKVKQQVKKQGKPAAIDLILLATYKKTEQIERGIAKKELCDLSKLVKSLQTIQPFNYNQVDLNQLFDKNILTTLKVL
jgi:hypothetical protein